MDGLSDVIPLQALLESRASFLLSYPSYDAERAHVVLKELEAMGVSALVLRGRHMLIGIPVMGKGHVGVVMAALLGGEEVAVKIRRTDANRTSMEAEARFLGVANGVSVGPQLLRVSKEALVMDLVDGYYLVDWVEGLGPGEVGLLRMVLMDLMEQARRMDVVGLDHGELSNARRHVIISKGVVRIVDFESASISRRCANVTSLAHYLFFNRGMAGRLEKSLPQTDRGKLKTALSAYRRRPGEGSFQEILDVARLGGKSFRRGVDRC
ncbi:hypothetical protein CL673_04570 [Candidatus Bathyarchaeota archaeon]|jgi:putative serine/threonine protein kinase|nr:hypothetical protein [Candidatus Bathyarchaeota archaeon]MDP6047892.1 hypothetical protein [Candidatus Bathyarchaeota archaeon]